MPCTGPSYSEVESDASKACIEIWELLEKRFDVYNIPQHYTPPGFYSCQQNLKKEMKKVLESIFRNDADLKF